MIRLCILCAYLEFRPYPKAWNSIQPALSIRRTDLSYAHRFWADPQTLTIGVGQTVVTNMMNRLDYLNTLYKPQAYLTDLTKMVFTELDTNKKVTPYRMAFRTLCGTSRKTA